MKKLYWKIYIWVLALRWIPTINIGDQVKYCGKIFTVINGVRAPTWKILREDECVEVREHLFQKVRTLENYWGSYKSGVRFYMTNWYGIWVRQGIKPWMRGCNIWKRN